MGLRGSRQLSRPDREVLEGEIGQGRRAGRGGGGVRLSCGHLGGAGKAVRQGASPDMRQQAVVKIRDFNHAGGGGGALAAHARYVARDAARPGDLEVAVAQAPLSGEREAAEGQARAHADYFWRGRIEGAEAGSFEE